MSFLGFCFVWLFSWEVEGHVNKCAFSEQKEPDLSHRSEFLYLHTVITGLYIALDLNVPDLSNVEIPSD